MVLKKEELLERIKTYTGDRTDDETIALVEDVTDTIEDMANRDDSSEEEWKEKYERLDEEWRAKYKERFFTTPTEVKEDQKEDDEKDGKETSFDDLFEEREA